MDLFGNDPDLNILPFDGEVNYFGQIMSAQECDECLKNLLQNIDWKNDELIVNGRTVVTKRKVCWYGDHPYDYTYSNSTKKALSWNEDLLKLKERVQMETRTTYNACLLNLYHSGDEGVTWHSDSEEALLKNGAIASLSFGASRKFSFKHKATRKTVSLMLEKGSLLVMKGATQTHWLHSLPKTTTVTEPRINLTFRTIVV